MQLPDKLARKQKYKKKKEQKITHRKTGIWT